MTARGLGWLGAVICLAALLFAMPALYVPGVGLLLLAWAASGWVRLAASGAQVTQRLERPMVVEGEPLRATIRTRRGRWPSPGGALECPPLHVPLPAGSRAPASSVVERHFERRGRHYVPGPVLRITDPLGIAERRITGREHEVLVLPRIEALRHVAAEGGGAVASRSLRGAAEENEIDGLRPYRPGAPASRIHWPAVARLGDLVERRLASEADATPLVVLDASAPASEDALDQAVRAAGSLCRDLASGGGCRVLLPGDARPTLLESHLRDWPGVWARLALVGPASAPPAARMPRAVTTLFWVTARRGAPRARTLAEAAEAYVVGPHVGTVGRPAFTVAGCTARRLRRTAERAA